MNKKLSNLSKDGKKELALAIHLWKDLKCQGGIDVDFFKQAIEFVEMLGIRKEFDDWQSELPPLIIEPRFK